MMSGKDGASVCPANALAINDISSYIQKYVVELRKRAGA